MSTVTGANLEREYPAMYLSSYVSNLDHQDSKGFTVLHLAAQYGKSRSRERSPGGSRYRDRKHRSRSRDRKRSRRSSRSPTSPQRAGSRFTDRANSRDPEALRSSRERRRGSRESRDPDAVSSGGRERRRGSRESRDPEAASGGRERRRGSRESRDPEAASGGRERRRGSRERRAGSWTRDTRERSRGREEGSESRSQDEGREERDADRRAKGLPPPRKDHISICTKTIWVGHLPKTIEEEELRAMFNDESRSQDEGREERDADRRAKGLPPPRKDHISICTKTIWVGHLPKTIEEEELRAMFNEYGGKMNFLL
ncbi:probable ATP-dependent RNA helicase DDX46 [Diaphorina citri]|uniref:Probable ATP-dependent RNA helicase DDX46 n=1 Tax=Diaphorina citri TaxID=121845 RepID=A0A3Q0JMD8_DIACI|nr:probable ATP-dependent RNA helicase DDX46 [Diaphorina citri]